MYVHKMAKNEKLEWLLFSLIALGFIWAKTYGIHLTADGDENTYYYMARLMSRGKIFYRDFFFAHPPLQLILLTLVSLIVGFNLILFKITAFLPVLIGTGFIYHYFWVKRERLSAFLFAVLFLFNYELLKITTHPFGLNLTACFLLISLYYFLKNRPFLTGIYWGLAALSGFYAFPWGIIPALYYLFIPGQGRGEGSCFQKLPGGLLYFAAAFLLTFGLFNGILLLIFKEDYLTPVFTYHFLKPVSSQLTGDVFIQVLRRNLPIYFLPFLYIWTVWTKKRTAVLAAGLIYIVFLATLNPLFTQYFMLPLPYLVWIGAVSVSGIIREKMSGAGRIILFLSVVILLTGFTADNIRRYLIHEAGTHFQNADGCRRFIRENSADDDLLFGHVTTTPMLALLSGRDIALDLVDTNHMRFKAGLLNFDRVWKELSNEPRLKFFIIQESRFWMSPDVQKYLNRLPVAAVFTEPRDRIIIYDCRPENEQSPLSERI